MTNENEFPIKHRNKAVEAFRLGLCLTSFVVSYENALLLHKYHVAYNKLGCNLSINDAANIRSEWLNELDMIKQQIKKDETNIS